MVSVKGKGKAKASKSKAESFDAPNNSESVIDLSGPTETNVEESLAVPAEEGRGENSNKGLEKHEEVDDEEIEEEDLDEKIVEGSNTDAKRKEKESNVGEVKNEENIAAVCKTNAEESMVVSQSEVRQEIMVVHLTDQTGGEADKMDSNLQVGDILGKKKLKKLKKKILKKKVIQRGMEATQSEVKLQHTDGSQPAGELNDVSTNELVKEDEKVEIKPADKVKNLKKVAKKKKLVQIPVVTVATIDDKKEPSNKNKLESKKELTEEQHVKAMGKEEMKVDRAAKKSRKGADWRQQKWI